MTQIWNTSGQSLHDQVLAFTAQDDAALDAKIFLPYDLQGTAAHVSMLTKIGILSDEEHDQIKTCLDDLQQQYDQGTFTIPEGMEDCHTAIEAYVTGKHGEVGKKIHTARSRNDQALTMIRLYMKDQLLALKESSQQLSSQWKSWAEQQQDVLMPGYTHMQKAMPTSVGVWQGAYADALEDYDSLLEAVSKIIDQSPLGSGAGFGIPLEIDRQHSAKELRFSRVQENPIACQLSRGNFEVMLLSTLRQVMTLVSRWANDLLLFTMSEFQYFSLPDEYCTSSSIMPQKKNYDVLEILRGSVATVAGAEQEVQMLVHSMHSGYQRDMQLLKAPLVRACQTSLDSLGMALLVSQNLIVHEEQLKEAMTPELYATHEVYQLVKDGMSFREAYAEVKKKNKA